MVKKVKKKKILAPHQKFMGSFLGHNLSSIQVFWKSVE